jgi:hypothetical protein
MDAEKTSGDHLIMKHCATISSRMVCADQPFIVFSQTTGLRASCRNYPDALEAWEDEVKERVQWGHDSDALVYSWNRGKWRIHGDIYDYEFKHADPSLLYPNRPF